MTAEYPAATKNFADNVDDSTEVNATYANQRDEEIEAVQNALGIYPYGGGIGSILMSPALRAFWPFSAIDNDGSAYNIVSPGRKLLFLGTENLFYGLYNSLTPYAIFNGIDSYFEAEDIETLGAQVGWNSSGMTLSCWVWLDTNGNNMELIAEGDGATAAGSNWELLYLTGTGITFAVFSGSSSYLVSGPELNEGQWYHIVAKFENGARISVTVDGVKYSNTSGIPSTLNYNSIATQIGARAGADLLVGRLALPFECGTALPDALIATQFSQQRGRFGV